MPNSPQPTRSVCRPRRRTAIAAIALLMALLAAACSGSLDQASDSGSSASSESFGADESFSIEAEAAPRSFEPVAEAASDAEASSGNAAGLTTGAASSGEPVAQLPDLGRDIIYVATVEIASTDVSSATRNIIRAIEGRGGFLFSQDTIGGAGGSSILTFKVFPDQFQAALNDLGSIGDVRAQSISADDVTAVVVDLESRINTSEASVIRLRTLLENATELETIATLENQLLQRETTLEQMRGQLRSVRNQVDLATITVQVTELLNRPGIAISQASYAGHDEGFGCFDNPTSRSGEVGDPITVCYRLTNTGDTPLVDLELADPTLGASIDSLVAIDGSTTLLNPGDSVTLAHEFDLETQLRLRTSVTANALDSDGNPLDVTARATAPTIRFDVTNLDEGFPSFGEVLGGSWDALKTAAIVIALIAVAIAPFLAAALLVGAPVWFLLRRRLRANNARPPAPTTRPAAPAPPAKQPQDTDDLGSEDHTDANGDEKATTHA